MLRDAPAGRNFSETLAGAFMAVTRSLPIVNG